LGDAHVVHRPAQALSQQTPSTQNPVSHCSPALQVCPGPRFPQLPLLQIRGARH
jgi:hypothetical protein